ncbi:MAG: hypothetical protein WCF75_03270 [Pseudolabrys sp.]
MTTPRKGNDVVGGLQNPAIGAKNVCLHELWGYAGPPLVAPRQAEISFIASGIYLTSGGGWRVGQSDRLAGLPILTNAALRLTLLLWGSAALFTHAWHFRRFDHQILA